MYETNYSRTEKILTRKPLRILSTRKWYEVDLEIIRTERLTEF
jgi:hypothetical protein